MKKMFATCAAALALALALNAATDMGVLVTTKNITDYAKVANGSGGTSTVTIVDTNGTANAVTVYNKSQMDTALGNKAAASDVTALQGRATALEGATNTLNTAVAGKLDKSGGTMTGRLDIEADGANSCVQIYWDSNHSTYYKGTSIHLDGIDYSGGYTLSFPLKTGTFAVTSDITNTVPAWARAESKPTYTFAEITSKPTSISGYGITDAKINNGTITLGSNSITPVTSETDPVWTADKSSYSTTTQMNTAIANATNGLAKASTLSGYVQTSRKVQGKALSADVTLYGSDIAMTSSNSTKLDAAITTLQTATNNLTTAVNGKVGLSQLKINSTALTSGSTVELGQYYIANVDGKPHLMLR